MRRAAFALLALATLASGCAGMGTKRSGGAQIQRTSEPAASVDNGSPLDSRPELGQR